MIDVDARGRHEAELLREEATRIADTETALQSVLDDVVLVPLVTHREAPPRLVVTRHPVSVRRRMPVLVGVAAAVAVVATLAFLPGNEPKVITPADTAVPSSTELVVRPLDPPIECELELCPSLAVSPEGTLVAYDQAAKTLTWYDAEPNVVPVTADLDAEHVQLEAIGPDGFAYLLAGSPDTQSWELVRIAQSGAEDHRTASASPDVEPIASGLRERSCWSGCVTAGRLLMYWEGEPPAVYPVISYTTGTVTAVFGELRWTIAWPHTLSTRSQVAPRWGGGAVLSLVPESADAPSELVELLPDGSVQRFGVGDETVQVLLPDGSAVVWRDGQLVRLSPPQPAAPPAAWSPELTARPLEAPIACNGSAWPPSSCPQLAVSPDGTLVALDSTAETLTWYEEEPRVVPLAAELPRLPTDGRLGGLVAIGPHDVAYLLLPALNFVAVAPSGAEITRMDWGSNQSAYSTATGLVPVASGWPSVSALTMPWVDLNGNPITDTRPYPTATATDAGIEVRLGEREWLLTGESWKPTGAARPGAGRLLDFRPRSDGGVVMLLDTFAEDAQAINLLELSPDGTIERYFVDMSQASLPLILPDGSLIVEHNRQLVRLTPPA
jgi:hypothetical protein